MMLTPISDAIRSAETTIACFALTADRDAPQTGATKEVNPTREASAMARND